MALARFQGTIQTETGAAVSGATVEVRNESNGLLAAIYSDRAGTSGLGNPFVASDPNGQVAFHVEGGAYRITVTKGALSREWRYEAIGTAGEMDLDDVIDVTDPLYATAAQGATADAAAPASRQVATSGLATGGGDLSANRTINVPKANLAQAQAMAVDNVAVTPITLLGAGWQQIGSTVTISSAVAQVDQFGMGDFVELLVLLEGLSHNNGSATYLQVFASADGSTFDTTAADYRYMNDGGQGTDGAGFGDTSQTGANTVLFTETVRITANLAGAVKMGHVMLLTNGGVRAMKMTCFLDVTASIKGLRVKFAAGSLDLGTIRFFGKRV